MRIERYLASDDPDFESTAADHRSVPESAAVFCVDEKTAIQALDRLHPVLPLSPGRAERHGFEYYRHGTESSEIWFSKVERDVIARGIFTSVKDLARKLRRYINAYSANANPI